MGTVTYTPCRWTVYTQTEQGWTSVRPLTGKTSVDLLQAFTTLTLYIGRDPPTNTDSCGYSLDDLSTGQYMFGIQGRIPDSAPNGGKTLFLAPFRAKK